MTTSSDSNDGAFYIMSSHIPYVALYMYGHGHETILLWPILSIIGIIEFLVKCICTHDEYTRDNAIRALYVCIGLTIAVIPTLLFISMMIIGIPIGKICRQIIKQPVIAQSTVISRPIIRRSQIPTPTSSLDPPPSYDTLGTSPLGTPPPSYVDACKYV